MAFDSYKSKYGASGGASGTTRKKYTADDIRGLLSGRTYGPQSEEEYRKQKERKRTYTAEDIRTKRALLQSVKTVCGNPLSIATGLPIQKQFPHRDMSRV